MVGILELNSCRNEARSIKPVLKAFSVKQKLLYDELLLTKEDIHSLTEQVLTRHPLPPPSSSQRKYKKTLRPPVQQVWIELPRFMVQFYRLTGQKRRYSLLFGLRISDSKVMFAQLSGSWYSHIGVPKFCIRVRNLIPEDAEIIKACKEGDIPTVKRLLLSGQAGLGDITTINETPLTARIP